VDTEPKLRKLFVRGLSWGTTSEMLQAAFSQFGDLEEAVVISDKVTGKSRGFGFVTFKETAAALAAIEQPSKEIDGRTALVAIDGQGHTPAPEQRFVPKRAAPAAVGQQMMMPQVAQQQLYLPPPYGAATPQAFVAEPVAPMMPMAMPGMQQQMPNGGMTGVTRTAYSNAEHKLFVRNLAFETTDQTLQMVFGAYGPIQEAGVLRDRSTGMSKRFGFVTFVNAEAAQRAIAAPPEIDGQSVIVNYNNDHKR